MSRGRPRRTDAKRYKDGKVSDMEQPRYQEDPRTLTAWKRAAVHHVELGLDPRIGTSFGRLYVTKRLNEPQFTAACKWSQLIDDYDVLILGKRRVAKPPAYERTSPGESAERSPEGIERFLTKFRAAHSALLVAGKLAEVAVTRLCRDEGVGAYFDDILRGLDALAAHWQLTGVKKHASHG